MTAIPHIIKFKELGDERGNLIALENLRQIPFEVKRVFYIFGTQHGVIRGLHAHRRLHQVLICVSGSVDIYCEYGDKKEIYHLDNPAIGLDIQGLIWHDMRNFSEDSVLLVLASEYYDETDYIRDYQQFLKEARK